MCQLPLEVSGEEKVLRAIRFPQHVKGNRLRPAALRSPAGRDEVSVMRHDHMGLEPCREKAKEIHGEAYLGLAVVVVQRVRDNGSEVKDTREEFCGHADLTHGVIVPANEPMESRANKDLTERIQKILNHVVYQQDPEPEAAAWGGHAF